MDFPAGPAAPPFLQTLRWLSRPISFLESCRRRFGDVFSVRFLGFQTPMVMVSDPEAIRALYTNPEHRLPPGRTLALQPIVGASSLLLLEGREHLARRKLMLPPFHGARMRAYEETVREVVARDVAGWPEGEPFAIHPHMQRVTLEVILRAVFGVTDPARRAALEDILSMLVEARFEGGEAMGDPEIRDQLMTLLLAGHETTATGLAWTFDLLLRNPAKLERLRSELESGDDAYLKAVISESLRLRPVVPLAGRRLSSELQVNGYTLPAGADVTPAIWLTHTREDIYPEPLEFKPERFLEDPPDTYGWIPFGGGVRRCLGAAFAEFEMRVVLREAVSRCELRSGRRRPQGIARRNITFSPKNGTPVVVESRR